MMGSLFGQRYSKLSVEPSEEGGIDNRRPKSIRYGVFFYALAGAALWVCGLVMGVVIARHFLPSTNCSSTSDLPGTIPKSMYSPFVFFRDPSPSLSFFKNVNNSGSPSLRLDKAACPSRYRL